MYNEDEQKMGRGTARRVVTEATGKGERKVFVIGLGEQ